MSIYSTYYNLPILLTDEQQQDPLEVLREFCLDFHLGDLRTALVEIAEACLSTDNPPFDEGQRRADLLYFQHHAELLFEAVFLIVQRNNAAQKE